MTSSKTKQSPDVTSIPEELPGIAERENSKPIKNANKSFTGHVSELQEAYPCSDDRASTSYTYAQDVQSHTDTKSISTSANTVACGIHNPADQGRNPTSEQRRSDVIVRWRRRNDVVPTSESDRWYAGNPSEFATSPSTASTIPLPNTENPSLSSQENQNPDVLPHPILIQGSTDDSNTDEAFGHTDQPPMNIQVGNHTADHDESSEVSLDSQPQSTTTLYLTTSEIKYYLYSNEEIELDTITLEKSSTFIGKDSTPIYSEPIREAYEEVQFHSNEIGDKWFRCDTVCSGEYKTEQDEHDVRTPPPSARTPPNITAGNIRFTHKNSMRKYNGARQVLSSVWQYTSRCQPELFKFRKTKPLEIRLDSLYNTQTKPYYHRQMVKGDSQDAWKHFAWWNVQYGAGRIRRSLGFLMAKENFNRHITFVVDTNILLQQQMLPKISDVVKLNAAKITVMVPKVVIEELLGLTKSTSERVRGLAQQALDWLQKQSHIKSNIYIQQKPEDCQTHRPHNKHENDNAIIQMCIDHKRINGRDKNLALVLLTNDHKFGIRATRAGIRYINSTDFKLAKGSLGVTNRHVMTYTNFLLWHQYINLEDWYQFVQRS